MIKRRSILFTVLIALSFACQSSEEERLKKDYPELEEILFDVHMARSASYLQPGPVRDSLYGVYLKKVEEMHSLREGESEEIMKRLKSANSYYQQLLLDLQERIADSLETDSGN